MRAVIALALTSGFFCLGAQDRTFESPLGFRLRQPKECEQQTPDPKERIVLAKFASDPVSGRPGSFLHAFWVVRIPRAKGPETGSKPTTEDEKLESLRDSVIAEFNDVHSLAGLLEKRFGDVGIELAPGTEKPERFKDGSTPIVTAGKIDKTPMQAFLVEDAGGTFGVVFFGEWDRQWAALARSVARSLERFEPGAGKSSASESAAEFTRGADFRREVRSRLQKGWSGYDSENFILITNMTSKTTIQNMLADLETMRVCYHERFPPVQEFEDVSLVRVFTTYEEYAAYGKLPGAIGHFSPLDQELVLFDPNKKSTKRNPWLKEVDASEVLYHEAMHQYLHHANGMLAPASWFGEGFGEVFAGAALDRRAGKVTKIDKNRGRMTWIKRSQRSGGWPDLRAFVKMRQYEFYGASVYQNYAFAWAFCYFLEQQRLDANGNQQWGAIPDAYLRNLREITAGYRKRLPDDAPKDWIMGFQEEIQDEAFDKTFGATDWQALENAWIAAMKKW